MIIQYLGYSLLYNLYLIQVIGLLNKIMYFGLQVILSSPEVYNAHQNCSTARGTRYQFARVGEFCKYDAIVNLLNSLYFISRRKQR